MARNKPIPTPEVIQDGAVTTINYEKPLRFMVTSDVHFDSAFSNREQFYKDLEFAKLTGSLLIVVGDFFDAMNGRFDPRRDMSRLRPEYRREDYYDYIVEDAVRLLKPFRRSILMITPGNHETAVLKNANTDLIKRLTEGLSVPTHTVYSGGYGGIINVNTNGGYVPIKYFHGSGGEAPVTRGAIQTNRQAVFLADFQIILNGHSHHMYYIPIARERVALDGTHYFDLQHHVRTPGYVMAYADGSSGWEVTRGGVPKPVGSVFIEIDGYESKVIPHICPPKPINSVIDMFSGMIFPQE